MPAPPIYTVEEIFEAVKDLNFYQVVEKDESKLYPLSEQVWDDAHEKLPKMSKKYIYLYISTKRNGIHEKLVKHHNLPDGNVSKADLDGSCHSNWSMSESEKIPFPPLRRTIYVSTNDYPKIKSMISYNKYDRPTLTPGWTSILYALLWQDIQLPCPFAFKYANLNDKPGEIFLTIRGECRECGNIIHVYIPTIEFSSTGLAINVSTFDTNDVVHKKKRFLSGTERSAVVKELQADSTYAWRRKRANETMQFGDREPAHLYSDHVLRKAKQLGNDAQLGLANVSDPIQSVLNLKYETEFAGFIKELAIDKFYVFYWSPEQIYLYKENAKCNNNDVGALSLDATGSLISRIKKPDGSSSPIFLYQAVVPFHGKILPVCQMVSEKHDANIMTYWLREWLRCGVPHAIEVVTDYSLALLNAVCLAFNNTSLSYYVDICIQTLQSPDETAQPLCIIRIDIAHMIKLVCRWKCFQSKHFSVKDFFVRCIGILTKCADINSFRAVFSDVLIVALTETESINSNDRNGSFAAQTRLMRAIKSDAHCYQYETDFTEPEDVDSNENRFDDCNTASKFIQDLVAECESLLINGERPNPYHCPEFANSFIRIAKHFPLWTAVMSQDKSAVATSSYSEEYFREIKQLVLKGKRALRADKFLVIHMRSLAGATKILHALHQDKGNRFQTRRKIRKLDDVTIDDEEFTEDDKVGSQNDVQFTEHAEEVTEGNYEDEITGTETEATREHTEIRMKKWVGTERDAKDSHDPIVDIKTSEALEIVHTDFEGVSSEFAGSKSFEESGRASLSQRTVKTMVTSEVKDDCNDTTDSKNSDCPNTYLNEIETWKGMNQDPKKRGKFLRPCPDIQHQHNRPKCITYTVPLLKNGSLLGPVTVKNRNIMVRNTCPIDSVSQSILVAYRDWASYQDHVRCTRNTFFDFVKLLDTLGCTKKIYKERALIMMDIKKIDSGVLNCMMNISNLIKNHLLADQASYTIHHKCKSCEHEYDEQSVVVEVDVKPFYTHGVKILQQALKHRLERKNQCTICRSSAVASTITTGNLIIVDIECLQWTQLAANLGHPDWSGTLTIGQMPEKIEVGNVTYTILSIIEYVGNSESTRHNDVPMGHYIAHVRRITGRWEVHNDLLGDNKPLLATSRMILDKKKLALVVYVKTI